MRTVLCWTFCLARLCSNVRIALPPSPLLDYRSSSLVWDISFQWRRSAEFDLTSEKQGSNILSQWCTQLWLLSDKERINQHYILWETEYCYYPIKAEFKSKTCYNLVESIVFCLFVSGIWSLWTGFPHVYCSCTAVQLHLHNRSYQYIQMMMMTMMYVCF